MSKDMILSLNGDTFQTLKNDFDTILARTIGNMTMKGADEATITLKLSISLEKSSIDTTNGAQDVTKPTFKHDISSVMQVKDKMTGQFNGEYGMVWDDEEERWVLRKIDNGQMNLFDEDGGVIDVDYHDVQGAEEDDDSILGIEESTTASETEHRRDILDEDIKTPFGWLCQFIGEDLNVTESMGDYVVRTESDLVVLSSSTSTSSPFYCPGYKLADHIGHHLVCVGYGQGDITNVAVECEDCNEVIYSLDAPTGEENAEENDDYEYINPEE